MSHYPNINSIRAMSTFENDFTPPMEAKELLLNCLKICLMIFHPYLVLNICRLKIGQLLMVIWPSGVCLLMWSRRMVQTSVMCPWLWNPSQWKWWNGSVIWTNVFRQRNHSFCSDNDELYQKVKDGIFLNGKIISVPKERDIRGVQVH